MDLINIPKTLPISIEKLVNYFHSKFKIKININEDFIKNIIDEKYSYNIDKKKKEHIVKITKKKGNKKHVNNIYIEKIKYKEHNNYEYINNDLKTKYRCKKCINTTLKYIVEKIINIKYSSDIKYLYNCFLVERHNYQFLSNSFFNLLDNHNNICNLFKNIKINLDELYKNLNQHKINTEIKMSLLEYEMLLNNILKITPTKELINIIY